MRWILASGSPRRKELLSEIGLKFDIIKADIDENITGNPVETAKKLSFIKAKHVFNSLNDKKDAFVIGADTIVVFNDKILGKPKNEEEAKKFLDMLSGKAHYVITGISIVSEKLEISDYEITKVFFKDLSEEEKEFYLNTKEWTDKAGGYGIQGKMKLFIEKIDGDYFNVVGFPVSKFYKILKDSGINVLKEL